MCRSWANGGWTGFLCGDRHCSSGVFDDAAFQELSRPYDEMVLEAAGYGKRILHTCGAYSQPERFNNYPIEGISWDTAAPGNPGLHAELRPTKVGEWIMPYSQHMIPGASVHRLNSPCALWRTSRSCLHPIARSRLPWKIVRYRHYVILFRMSHI